MWTAVINDHICILGKCLFPDELNRRRNLQIIHKFNPDLLRLEFHLKASHILKFTTDSASALTLRNHVVAVTTKIIKMIHQFGFRSKLNRNFDIDRKSVV